MHITAEVHENFNERRDFQNCDVAMKSLSKQANIEQNSTDLSNERSGDVYDDS